MARYIALAEIAEAMANKIRATEKFKLVTYAQATNGAQVWQILPGMASLPCAVVAIGMIDFENDALKRVIRPIVFVLDTFKRSHVREAEGIWELTECVNSIFLPEEHPEGVEYPEICGIEFIPANWSPIESPDNVCAYCLSFEGVEFLIREK